MKRANYKTYSTSSRNFVVSKKMDINVEKTKVFSKIGGEKCNVVINGVVLIHVIGYKYFSCWITEDGRCEQEVKTRIAVAKEAFWYHKELMWGNLRMSTKKRMLECYVFLVLRYACESWTLIKILQKRVDAFETDYKELLNWQHEKWWCFENGKGRSFTVRKLS